MLRCGSRADLLGLWYGLLTGYSTALLVIGYYMYFSNWEEYARRAREHAEVFAAVQRLPCMLP